MIAVVAAFGLVSAVLVPAAWAADSAKVNLALFGNIAYLSGSGFPARTTVAITAEMNRAKGSATAMTSSRGSFGTLMSVPRGQGVLKITAKAGNATATINRTIGRPVATTTTAKPATTTTAKLVTTTTAKPATTTTVKPLPTTQPPVVVPGPVGGSGTWRPIFTEEFNGTTVNRSRFPNCHWATRPGCSGHNQEELAVFKPENVTVGGGTAKITAKRQPTFVPERNATMPYTGGVITTGPWGANRPTFDFKYGYIESRIKIAPGAGIWSAFWLAPSDLNWPPEIDIMEAANFEPNRVLTGVHYKTPTGRSSDAIWQNGPLYANDFHTFGVEWTPTAIHWFIDGRRVWSITDANKVPQKSMYPIINVSIGGWAGLPRPNESVFPATTTVDYIRVWQR